MPQVLDSKRGRDYQRGLAFVVTTGELIAPCVHPAAISRWTTTVDTDVDIDIAHSFRLGLR